MKTLWELPARQQRRHRKLLARIRAKKWIYFDYWKDNFHEFRMALRLHDAGLVTACVEKVNLLRALGIVHDNPYWFREIAVFADEAEALRQYPKPVQALPRRVQHLPRSRR
jgi:hypothetical protein